HQPQEDANPTAQRKAPTGHAAGPQPRAAVGFRLVVLSFQVHGIFLLKVVSRVQAGGPAQLLPAVGKAHRPAGVAWCRSNGPPYRPRPDNTNPAQSLVAALPFGLGFVSLSGVRGSRTTLSKFGPRSLANATMRSGWW